MPVFSADSAGKLRKRGRSPRSAHSSAGRQRRKITGEAAEEDHRRSSRGRSAGCSGDHGREAGRTWQAPSTASLLGSYGLGSAATRRAPLYVGQLSRRPPSLRWFPPGPEDFDASCFAQGLRGGAPAWMTDRRSGPWANRAVRG